MFKSLEGLKKLETINGAESHFDSKRSTYVLRVLVDSIEEIKIPDGYLLYGSEIYTEDLETKICCVELPPLH